ncbi:MAG: LysR family transcriptional regulator [Pseudomonadota bacterium]
MEYRNLPDLSGWAALRAVVEKGGVSEAARALKIGQPAVTKRLRALEECYGLPLMERVGGRLKLTAAGEKVYPLAAQTLDRQLALREDLQSLVGGRKTLRLEVSFAIGEHLLPELLLRFAERFPKYKINSRLGYSRQIQTHIASGLADLALLEGAPDHPDILVQKWMDDELWLVCGPTHALAGTELIPVEQLQKLNYVLRERRSAIRDALDEALRAIGVQQLDVAMEVGSTDAIVEILARGRHVSFLPRFAVAKDVAQGKLARIKVTGFRIMRMLWVARNRSKLDHPVAEAFIKLLRETTPAPGG